MSTLQIMVNAGAFREVHADYSCCHACQLAYRFSNTPSLDTPKFGLGCKDSLQIFHIQTR